MFDYKNLYRKTGGHVFRTEPGFPLRVTSQRPQTVTVSHHHDFCECVFVTRGHGKHQTEKREPVSITRGCILVIPKGGSHAYTEASSDLEIINLLFEVEQLPPVLLELYSSPVYKQIFLRDQAAYEGRDFPQTRLRENVFGELETLLGCLLKVCSAPGRHCYKLGLFMALLSRLCEVWRIPAGETLHQPLDIPRLTAYLKENFRRQVYLEELEKLTSMSRATLQRHFRAAMGVTPMIYLRNLRIRRAAELLLNTDFSLKEVADQSGFTSLPYFFRAFRTVCGASPLEYRTAKLLSAKVRRKRAGKA